MRFTTRTANSRLFVNPLMAIYFSFTVPGLAAASLYLDRLEPTRTMLDVASAIASFRTTVTPRPARPFPH